MSSMRRVVPLAGLGDDFPRGPSVRMRTGLVARATRRLVSERVLAVGTAMDYRTNL